jgi:hypothetical protein
LCHGKCKLTFPNSIPIIVSYNEPQFYWEEHTPKKSLCAF